MTPPNTRKQILAKHGTMRTDVALDLVPWGDLVSIENFIVKGGKAVKAPGMTALNTTAFEGRVLGIAEWRRGGA